MSLTSTQIIAALKERGLFISTTLECQELLLTYASSNSEYDILPNTIFFCKSAVFKESYLLKAISKGVQLYVSEKPYPVKAHNILVSDVRRSMAVVACLINDFAFTKLKLIGITGTKGKTTAAYYIKYILDGYLNAQGLPPSGIISSIDTFDGVVKECSKLTTPEAIVLHRHFSNAVKSALPFMTMEVSSQALKYDRVYGVTFDSAVFLNISPDHISPIEHNDFEDYFSSKLKIFSQCRVALVNLDSDYSDRILSAAKNAKKIITFGTSPGCDVYGYAIKKVDNKIYFKVRTKDFDREFCLEMPGLFNVENALAAIAACVLYRVPPVYIASGLLAARAQGRMELFHNADSSIIAIIDYAHNKLSFEKLFETVKKEYPGRKIICVFGCPGGKAYNRRKELVSIAGEFSEKIYLTSEDPGPEDVNDINKEIASYASCETVSIADRQEAITQAISQAPENSILLITGKGAETTQKVGDEYVPYESDTAIAKRLLEETVTV